MLLIPHFREAYDHLLEQVPVSVGERIVLKHEDYPNITYWFCHEYFSALAEDKITSVDDVPVKARVRNTLKPTTTTAMERMGLVYMSSLVVHPGASKAKGKLCKVRMSKCVIFSTRMAMLLMAGEPWTYAVMQGRFSLDSHCKGKCFKAGSKEWMPRAVSVITATWWQDSWR